tara:strand:- start:2758 stop:4107 length:1350 start_codon:yes stop_codon:yes gene_type:complete
MEEIKKKINYSFTHLFNMPKHPFFMDLIRVEKISKNYIEYQNSSIKEIVPYKKTSIPKEEKINIKSKKELSDNKLKKLNSQLKVNLSFINILKLVSEISKYVIKSNVSNYDKLFNNFKKDKNKINIAIIGAGPVGLFLAIYLNIYYNKGSLNNYPKVNIVIFDNRIEKSKFRKPYSRYRPFSTSSNFLPIVLPKLYCYQKNQESLYLNIFLLEYMLFTKARLEHNIPFIFENYKWDDYKNIIEKGDIDVMFDCTGGRLNPNIFNNINTKWLNKINKVNKKLKKQLHIDKKNNLVKIEDYPKDKTFKKNHYYGSLMVYDKDLNFGNKYDIDINDISDLKLLLKIKKKYYSITNVLNIVSNFKDYTCRNFLNTILQKNKMNYENNLFSFDVWEIYIRHCIQPCEIFSINKKNILYIGAGDTIFHSHFITGAGLNRTLNFSIKCANILSLLK